MALTWRHSRTAPRTTAALVVAVLAAPSAGGCSLRERVCGSDEYPVRTVGTTDGGPACTPDGEEPPAGYERFPDGEVPEHVDDVYP